MTFFGTTGPYASPFHEYPPPVAFDLVQAVAQAALFGAMDDAGIPKEFRLRLANKFVGRMLASELNPNRREAQ